MGKYVMLDRMSRNDAIEVNPPQETGQNSTNQGI